MPRSSTLEIRRLWDGSEPERPQLLRAELLLEPDVEGVYVTARAPHQPHPRVPEAPPGERVADLWRYDVVELFLVGADLYLEVELGPEGRFLVLDFSAPRQMSSAFQDLRLRLAWGGDEVSWWTRALLPRAILPRGIKAANAFAVLGGVHMAWYPVPGAVPDFHQPSTYPSPPPCVIAGVQERS